jgi:hypothetical protein
MNIVKLCHNYWHTGSRHQTFYGGERPCCLCQETKEDWRHIISCPSLDTDYHRAALWQKVKNDMQMWCLPADFWTAIEKGIQHLSQDTQESTSPPLPLHIAVTPIRNRIRAAFKKQNSIKWTNIYKGHLSHKWQQFATAHVRSKRLDLRAQEWGPKFVSAMWDHSLRMWQFRNDAFHADTNAQVKGYKLEELERLKTRLRSQHTELKPLLHIFQQKHFDSPDTVNGLRYDIQKCWKALAKLFLDEAESRLPSTDNELIPRYLTT